MTLTVSELDLIGAKTDGMSRMDLARDMGVSRSAVTRSMDRYGIDLRLGASRPPMDDIREAAEGMNEAEAVEWLLGVIESILGDPSQDTCLWPDIDLTPKERALVQFLYSSEGSLRSKPQIMDALYSALEDPPVERVIDVFVCKLRKKLQGTGANIVTVWGRGYRFERDAGAVFPWEAQE